MLDAFVRGMCSGSLAEVGKLQFSHKSFSDWLVGEGSGDYRVQSADGDAMLAEACLKRVSAAAADAFRDEYALKHGVAHLLAASRSAEARALVLENVAWLMARSGDGLGIMEDCRRLVAAAGEGGDRAVDLVRRALDLSMPELRQDPRRLPGQLVGRLMGSGAGSLVAARPAAGASAPGV